MVNKKVILARKIYAESTYLEGLEKELGDLRIKHTYAKTYKLSTELINEIVLKRKLIKSATNKIEKWQKEHDQLTE